MCVEFTDLRLDVLQDVFDMLRIREPLQDRIENAPSIDEYLRKRLLPVEAAIPQLPGIEMYGI